jgi:hypothetical protein
MTGHNDGARAALDKFLSENALSEETILYREVLRDALTSTENARVYRLGANTAPSDSVIDVYGHGHLVQAEEVGPGLSFAESARPNWQETMEMRTLRASHAGGAPSIDRVTVEVRLADILRQGGRIYPVESVTVERAWYCTLPEGSIAVREAGTLDS